MWCLPVKIGFPEQNVCVIARTRGKCGECALEYTVHCPVCTTDVSRWRGVCVSALVSECRASGSVRCGAVCPWGLATSVYHELAHNSAFHSSRKPHHFKLRI